MQADRRDLRPHLLLATRLLTAQRRRAVHALYAFARMVDNIVDRVDQHADIPQPDKLKNWI